MSKISLFIAEDDPDDQYLISKAFSNYKHSIEIVFFDNGEILVNKLNETLIDNKVPDLLILDLNMPILNGFEVLEYIKNVERLNQIPSYIFSTSSMAEDVKRCKDLGATDYIEKPANIFQFRKSLLDIVNNIKKLEVKPNEKLSAQLNILIIDDDEDDIFLLEKIIKNLEINNISTKSINGLMKIDLLDGEFSSPDLVFLDLNLGSTHGTQTFKLANKYFEHTPIIIISGYFDVEKSEQYIKLGASDFIDKSELSEKNLNKAIKFTLERHALIQKLKKDAFLDPLTGLANRSRFNDRLEVLVNIAERFSTSLALIFIDLDKFKEINDTHGHIVGDSILKFLSGSLKKIVRKSDLAARLGGDEFCIILYEYGGQEALKKWVHNMIEVVTKESGYKSDDKDINLSIEVSIGVACYQNNESADHLIERADKLMYKSKTNGASIPYFDFDL